MRATVSAGIIRSLTGCNTMQPVKVKIHYNRKAAQTNLKGHDR